MINDCVNFALERRNIGFVLYGTREQIAQAMEERAYLGQEVSMFGFKKWSKGEMPTWRHLASSTNWTH